MMRLKYSFLAPMLSALCLYVEEEGLLDQVSLTFGLHFFP